jgi:hypothetical protein
MQNILPTVGPNNGVTLARGGLTIGKEARIVPTQDITQEWLDGLKHFALLADLIKHTVVYTGARLRTIRGSRTGTVVGGGDGDLTVGVDRGGIGVVDLTAYRRPHPHKYLHALITHLNQNLLLPVNKFTEMQKQ